MHLEKYKTVADHDYLSYKFFSVGPKGIIKKGIQYKKIKEDVYNLAFGDWNEQEQKIDDTVRSNNNDRDKVLATVAATVIDFISHHPKKAIFAIGATVSRTRLYQMGIHANWQQIDKLFIIMGFINGEWEVFVKGRNYEAFLLKAK